MSSAGRQFKRDIPNIEKKTGLTYADPVTTIIHGKRKAAEKKKEKKRIATLQQAEQSTQKREAAAFQFERNTLHNANRGFSSRLGGDSLTSKRRIL